MKALKVLLIEDCLKTFKSVIVMHDTYLCCLPILYIIIYGCPNISYLTRLFHF